MKNNNNSGNKNTDISSIAEKKVVFFQDIVQKTILNVQKNKLYDILGINEVSSCISSLNEISNKLKECLPTSNSNCSSFVADKVIEIGGSNSNHKSTSTTAEEDLTISNNTIVEKLQIVSNELSSVFKVYGTESLDDLLNVCLGNSYYDNWKWEDDATREKFLLLKKYFHPTGYKNFPYKIKSEKGDKNIDKGDDDIDNLKNMDCFDIANGSKKFHLKVYGSKLFIHHSYYKRNFMIHGIIDDIVIPLLNNSFISNKIKNIQLYNHNNLEKNYNQEDFTKFIESLSLKDYLVYNVTELFHKFMGYVSQVNISKQRTILSIVNEFNNNDMYLKRLMLIQLLVRSSDYENQYLAYLLYDLLSNDSNDQVDTIEQKILFDSFPWEIKKNFKDAMKKTIKYTMEITNFDTNKIPLEQQICLLKANDSVKEKAMIKLKEVKAKSDDSGTKARQYLEGLLKIPFKIYRKEPVMHVMNNIRSLYSECVKQSKNKSTSALFSIPLKSNSLEVTKGINHMKYSFISDVLTSNMVKEVLQKYNKKQLWLFLEKMNKVCASRKVAPLIFENASDVTKLELIKGILKWFHVQSKTETGFELFSEFVSEKCFGMEDFPLYKNIVDIEQHFTKINDYIVDVKTILDKSVYGHEKAKKQIQRIIGQWIHGEPDGYCFGFEGPPGVGKTSLAKLGLSECLKDEHGNSRPFAMIQMGGDSNGSTLHGHNYTYVGSTWGGIVQILMDKKCMNPIIFIDEVDKISKTEHGKEIVGILTHLLDSTQNDCFQDKYFSGVDLDLSKALFILSYNDPSEIDKILLDRIHRIKFQNLSVEDKVIIAKNHMLKEVYKKMGLENVLHFSDETLKFIIEEYTQEPGVRKYKEALFEIVGEVNLELLCMEKQDTYKMSMPIEITIDDIKNKFFKERREVRIKRIHEKSEVGVINCLWANGYGYGGILSSSGKWVPSNKFIDLKLTGLIDDMMKESFQISLTLAFDATSEERKKEIIQKYDGDVKYGIHMHMGDGSVPKSGTSAGIAISILLYSLLNNVKIKNDFAVTGEAADLRGSSGEIGALKTKIIYGIKAGVRNFIYPRENQKDMDEFMEKYGTTEMVKGVQFFPVDNLRDALDLILDI